MAACEQRWLEAVRAGEERAFTEAFDAMYPAVRVFLYRYTQSMAVAEEIAQDVFVTWWTDRARLDIRTSLRTYLFVAARNRALNVLRHEKLAQQWAADVAAGGEPSRDDADWAAREAEVAQAIVDAVDALPVGARRIFLMHRTTTLSYAEIATRLGVSVKAVDTQLTRAVRTLRGKLAAFRG
jgi:RNA polymerase sigma-70 factor (family 1)